MQGFTHPHIVQSQRFWYKCSSYMESIVDICIIYICMKVHVYCNHVCEIYNTCFNVCINADVSRPCWCSVSLLISFFTASEFWWWMLICTTCSILELKLLQLHIFFEAFNTLTLFCGLVRCTDPWVRLVVSVLTFKCSQAAKGIVHWKVISCRRKLYLVEKTWISNMNLNCETD